MSRANKNLQEDLAYDINAEATEKKLPLRAKHHCPRISVKINEQSFENLLDSGSNATCISEESFAILKTKSFKILPVTNLFIAGAFGKKSLRIKNQIYVELLIGERQIKTILLIVPSLSHIIIIGSDWLLQNKVIIDYDDQSIQVQGTIIREPQISFTSQKPETFKSINVIEDFEHTIEAYDYI